MVVNVVQNFTCTDVIKRVFFTLTREEQDGTIEEFISEGINFIYINKWIRYALKYSLHYTVTLKRSNSPGYWRQSVHIL